jgi:NADP-dependent 3-hydroxy acid dehydrogenase YdfG
MIAYITGATSGIGEACARKFATMGWDLIITGRRKERLEELQSQIIEAIFCKSSYSEL